MKHWLSSGIKTTLGLMAIAFLQNPLLAAPVDAQTVRGNSGGSVESQNCGFIAATPSHTISLSERVDYMKLLVEADGGKPTLLVIGPKAEDSFCVLGDLSAGLNPEISGVWEPGTYQIYVGDRDGESHQFTLSISSDKN
jgi:hypothetical protein